MSPKVSIIIPTRDRLDLIRVALNGLIHRTRYSNVEIIVVDNGSEERETLDHLQALERRGDIAVLRDGGPFNFSRLSNRGAASASGEILLFLNNDVDVIHEDWLDEIVSHVLRPEIGAVGVMLYYENNTIQHAGVILGVGSVAGHAFRGHPRAMPTAFHRSGLTRNLSAVTGACLAVRRGIFEEVGGFDEVNLPVAYNDVDLCLRIRAMGYRILWTPFAELYHRESASRGIDVSDADVQRSMGETRYMLGQWGAELASDPFFNPNLALTEDFEVAEVSRVARPWAREL
jgi:GT2 family glycosyltransferase